MVKRIIVTFEDEVVDKLNEMAKSVNTSRNSLVNQIVRKYFEFSSLLKVKG